MYIYIFLLFETNYLECGFRQFYSLLNASSLVSAALERPGRKKEIYPFRSIARTCSKPRAHTYTVRGLCAVRDVTGSHVTHERLIPTITPSTCDRMLPGLESGISVSHTDATQSCLRHHLESSHA